MTAVEFDSFFAQTYPGMRAKAFMLSGNRHDAEDAVLEAYLEALRRWERLGDYEAPEAWVYRIMRQRLWASTRRTAKEAPSGFALETAGLQAGPELTAEVRAVLTAISGLPPTMRFVMVLHCLYAVPQTEIAKELGMTSGAVRNRLHSARLLLKKTLGMTTSVSADERLVRTPGPGLEPSRSSHADPLLPALREAEWWLSQVLAADAAALAQARESIITQAGESPPPRRRWRDRLRGSRGGTSSACDGTGNR